MGFCCYPPSYQIRRGTTPRLKFTLPCPMVIEDLSIAFSQGGVMLFEKKIADGGIAIIDRNVFLSLAQEDTLKFKANKVAYIQISIKDQLEFVTKSDFMRLEIEDSIRGSVM